MAPPPEPLGNRQFGRYALHGEIACGGMASVHFGRLLGPVGFARTVAIKRLHPQYARDPEFVAMFLDEARLAARVRHPCVAATIDVVATEGEIFLVMEYVHGESLARLLRTARGAGGVPVAIVGSVLSGALHGLHAAHVATSESGAPLGIVHRDISPENILVGVDGIARVIDFGIAYAAGRAQVTREGRLKGKLAYMAPEVLEGGRATPLADVYGAGVVLWEALTGERLFTGDNEGQVLTRILRGTVAAPSTLRAGLSSAVDELVLRALARDPALRFPTALAFALEVEKHLRPASAREVGEWVNDVARESLAGLASALATVEGARGTADHAMRGEPHEERTETTLLARGETTETNLVAAPWLDDTAETRAPREDTITNLVLPPPSARVAPEPLPPAIVLAEAPRRRGPIVAGVLAIAVIGLVAGKLAFRADAPVNAPTASSSAAPAEPPPPSTGSDSIPASEPPPSFEAARSAEPPPPAAPGASKAKPGTRRVPAQRTQVGCDPPYTVDDRGFHHFKPQCM
jgi:serine/threonine-protein kinase